MNRRITIAGGALALLVVSIVVYRNEAVPPDCSSQATVDLVKKILIEQFKLSNDIQLANIRTSRGGLLASRFECDGTVQARSGGLELRPVRYTSEITEDSHRHYVTAQVFPGLSEGNSPQSDDTDSRILEIRRETARQQFAFFLQEKLNVPVTALGDALLVTSSWGASQRARFLADLTTGGACGMGFRKVRFTGLHVAAEEVVIQGCN
jgi:hypothetical protein